MAEPQDIVLAAVMAAGPAGQNMRAWRMRVTELVPAVAALLRAGDYGPSDVAAAVLDSTVFKAEFVNYEIEESSKRAILTLKTQPSKDYPDGLEPIRSYPAWAAIGYHQIERIKQLNRGDRLTVFKAIEDMEAGRKVRVLAHFEVIGQASSRGSSSPTPPADPVDVGPAASTPTEGEPVSSAPSAPASPVTGSLEQKAVAEWLAKATNKQKIEIAKRCNAAGIPKWVEPEPDNIDAVLTIVKEVTSG